MTRKSLKRRQQIMDILHKKSGQKLQRGASVNYFNVGSKNAQSALVIEQSPEKPNLISGSYMNDDIQQQ